jgi:hypothetical protein
MSPISLPAAGNSWSEFAGNGNFQNGKNQKHLPQRTQRFFAFFAVKTVFLILDS